MIILHLSVVNAFPLVKSLKIKVGDPVRKESR
jgi:hypothetical protein